MFVKLDCSFHLTKYRTLTNILSYLSFINLAYKIVRKEELSSNDNTVERLFVFQIIRIRNSLFNVDIYPKSQFYISYDAQSDQPSNIISHFFHLLSCWCQSIDESLFLSRFKFLFVYNICMFFIVCL